MDYKIKIDFERCKGCGLCVDACKKENIEISEELNKKGYFPAIVKKDYDCNGCGNCYQVCVDVAIEIREKETKDV